MRIFAIETSCDETSLAVLELSGTTLATGVPVSHSGYRQCGINYLKP